MILVIQMAQAYVNAMYGQEPADRSDTFFGGRPSFGRSRNILIYGHSHVVKLSELCEELQVQPAQLFYRPNDAIRLHSHRGLNYARMFDRIDHYFRPIMESDLDILVMVMGSNDLCDSDVGPQQLEERVLTFLDYMNHMRIRPRITTFLSVLKRTALSQDYEGQIHDITEYNHRVDSFNQMIQGTLAPRSPAVQVYSQESYNRAPYLGRCHLTRPGLERQVTNLTHMFTSLCAMLDREDNTPCNCLGSTRYD